MSSLSQTPQSVPEAQAPKTKKPKIGSVEDVLDQAKDEAAATYEAIARQNPELKKQQEAMMLNLRAKNKREYLTTRAVSHADNAVSKMEVRADKGEIPAMDMIFGVESPLIIVNGKFAVRDIKDGKFYEPGTKNEVVLKPKDKLEFPTNKDTFQMYMRWARAEGAERELMAKKESELTPADISKMTKLQKRSKFFEPKDSETFYVNFKNEKAEQKIGLEDLMYEDTSVAMVTFGKKHKGEYDKSVYAVKGKDGKYFNPVTGKRVPIFTGDTIYEPESEIDSAKMLMAAQELDREASARKEMLAKREKAKKREEQSPGSGGGVYVAKK